MKEEIYINVEEIVKLVGTAVDLAGVAVIVVGVLIATTIFLARLQGRPGREDYRRYRQGIGRAILLGLEFLVAGDIIRTVAVSPTFHSVGVLAAIVGIRTFTEHELGGRARGALDLEPRQAFTVTGRYSCGIAAMLAGSQERRPLPVARWHAAA